MCVSDRAGCCAPQPPSADAADTAQTHLRQSHCTTGQTHATIQTFHILFCSVGVMHVHMPWSA